MDFGNVEHPKRYKVDQTWVIEIYAKLSPVVKRTGWTNTIRSRGGREGYRIMINTWQLRYGLTRSGTMRYQCPFAAISLDSRRKSVPSRLMESSVSHLHRWCPKGAIISRVICITLSTSHVNHFDKPNINGLRSTRSSVSPYECERSSPRVASIYHSILPLSAALFQLLLLLPCFATTPRSC